MKFIVGENNDAFKVFEDLKAFMCVNLILEYLEDKFDEVDYEISTDGYVLHTYKIDNKYRITVLVNFRSIGFLRYHYIYLETKDEVIDSFRIIEDNTPGDDLKYLEKNKPKLMFFEE